MKRSGIIAAFAAVALTISSCGIDDPMIYPKSGPVEENNGWQPSDDAEQAPQGVEKDEPSVQRCTKTIKNRKRPELVKVRLSGKCSGDIRHHASAEDIYGVNVLHDSVLGMVGVPIELHFDSEVSSPVLTFIYDPDELRGVPEKNLLMLHFLEDQQFYETMRNAVVDTDSNSVVCPIKDEGIYLLTDAYQWNAVWGEPVEGYEYEIDKTDYITDWEREEDTGSIMELADKSWAVENAPDLHVSNETELASAVWYINGFAEGEVVNVYIEDDIDLTGYKWRPMGMPGMKGNGFSGNIIGNGHTINGLEIKGGNDVGFVGYGYTVNVSDLSLTNVKISGNGCVGAVAGETYGDDHIVNVYVSGTVDGGREDTGSIIGREGNAEFTDCKTDVLVNGIKTEYFSYRQKRIDDVGIEEVFRLKLNDDYTVTRDEHPEFDNITWVIIRDGKRILGRGAEDETVLETHKWVGYDPGKYTIYLEAYVGGIYIRRSNILEYVLE